MGIISGKGTRVQIGHETVWGTAAAPTVAIAHLTEGIVPAYEKTEEASLVGGKVAQSLDTMKVSVSGDITLNAKPDGIGDLLYLGLGKEESAPVGDTLNGYLHTMTLVDAGKDADMPSMTVAVDRHVAKRNYTGMKVGSMGLSAQAGDRLTMNLSVVGRAELLEDDGSFEDLAVLTLPTKKAFRFADGKLKLNGSDTDYCKVTSIDVNVSNNFDDGPQTLCSGLHGSEMQPQQREVTVSLEALYNDTFEALRKSHYVGDVATDLELTFTSFDDIPGATAGVKYELVITIPEFMISDMNPTVGGPDRLTLSIAGTALDNGTDEPLTISLLDDLATKYVDRV